MAAEVAFQRPLGRHPVGQARAQAGEGIDAARGRAGVAGVEDEGHVRVVARQLADQHRQFLVGQVVVRRACGCRRRPGPRPARRVELAERRRRSRLRAVAAVVEHRHVAVAGAAEVAAEQRE